MEPVCVTCNKQLDNPKKTVLRLSPCGHRIHSKCIEILKNCPRCTKEIKGLVKDDSTFLLSSRQADSVENIYFESLNLLIKESPICKRNVATVTARGEDNVPSTCTAHLDGFYFYGESWVECILKRTLQNLNNPVEVGTKNTWARSVVAANVAILVLNSQFEQIMYGPKEKWKEDRLHLNCTINGFEKRCQNETKANQTYILNVSLDSRSTLLQKFTGAHYFHITNFPSLCESHLQIASNIAGSSEQTRNAVLKSFQDRCHTILKGRK